jgi:DNA-binding HxlR family transcriptional regulator
MYMKKHSPTQQAKTSPSITSVLRAISDEKALLLFNTIVSDNNGDRFSSLKEMNLSTKQYYSRVSSLLKAGLVKRQKGKYFPTLLGRVVCDSQMMLGEALSQYWKLKAIESIEMSCPDLPAEEITQLINALIDSHQIKDILMKPVDAPCDEAKSKIQIPQTRTHNMYFKKKDKDTVKQV